MPNTRSGMNMAGGDGDPEMVKAHRLIAIDKLYITPPFQIRIMGEHEKLSGHKNFKTWKAMVELDLRALLNLLAFIETDCGLTVNVSPAKRVILDAQTVQYLCASVSKSICQCITNANTLTTYRTFQTLVELLGGSRTQNYISLHDRKFRLQYRSGYDEERFLADFEKLLCDFHDIGTDFGPEYTKTLFLQKIEGINDPKSCFFGFYKTMPSLPNVDMDTIKEKFSNIAANL